jgi:hypothetical protein
MLEMPCQDCERAIAELRRELDAMYDVFEARQKAMLAATSKVIDNLEAQNQKLLASIDQQVRNTLSRIEAVARSMENEGPPSVN